MSELPSRASRWTYAPYRADLSAPGDRRRFCFWAAARGREFEVATRSIDTDVAVLSARADLSAWRRAPRGQVKIVYDIVDSYLAIPPNDLRSRLRGPGKFLARETSRLVVNYRVAMEDMIRRADAVVCASQEQREAILPLNRNVHVILDSHGELDSSPKPSYARGRGLHLVWEGLPENIAGFAAIKSVLAALDAEEPVHLHLVTAIEYSKYVGRFGRRRATAEADAVFPRTSVYQWHPRTLPAIAHACDLAIIPLDLTDPLASGKPENKLLSFWRMGMPTVTSATPSYSRVMGVAGLHQACTTEDDWLGALRALRDDEATRRATALKGHQYVLANHTDPALLDRWDDAFASIGAI